MASNTSIVTVLYHLTVCKTAFSIISPHSIGAQNSSNPNDQLGFLLGDNNNNINPKPYTYPIIQKKLQLQPAAAMLT
jgi:hypothetical protein